MSPDPSPVLTSRTLWPVQRRFPIYYHDIDVLNHLNHAAYFPFMETLRCDYYLKVVGSLDPSQLDIIIAEATCRYLAPVQYGEELVGEVAPALPLGRSSFSLLYRFTEGKDPSKVCARGRTVVVCYDYAKNVKKEIPPERRARLERDGVDPVSEGWSCLRSVSSGIRGVGGSAQSDARPANGPESNSVRSARRGPDHEGSGS